MFSVSLFKLGMLSSLWLPPPLTPVNAANELPWSTAKYFKAKDVLASSPVLRHGTQARNDWPQKSDHVQSLSDRLVRLQFKYSLCCLRRLTSNLHLWELWTETNNNRPRSRPRSRPQSRPQSVVFSCTILSFSCEFLLHVLHFKTSQLLHVVFLKTVH